MAIVSFSKGFAFIKTRKTAGTSMEVHLARQCGEDDIVTPIYPEAADHRPRNFASEDGRQLFSNHMPAARIAELIGPRYDSLFKFCFERHPVDKCLSHYALLLNSPYHRRADGPRTWEEYLERADFPVDTPGYTDESGALIVDRIFRYEEIDAALHEISARTQLAYAPMLVREKSGFRYNVPSLKGVMGNKSEYGLIMDAFASTLRYIDY